MRMLWYWVCWIALSGYALTLDRQHFLFPIFVTLLLLFGAVLTIYSLWSMARLYLTNLRHNAHERKIRHRDQNTESPLEVALASELDRACLKYVREYQISRTRVDFAFIRQKLVVECDGYRYHHDRQREDAARDSFLRRQGWRVVRFSGNQIRADAAGCVKIIREHLG